MKPVVKVVLDANVLLSGAFTRGLCSRIVDALVGSRGVRIYLSEALLAEFRERSSGKFKAPPEKSEAFLEQILRWAVLVIPAQIPADACRDADDLHVLGAAVAAGAEVLVTGDKDLLAVGSFRDVAILSPREFSDRFLTSG